ncbi:TetR/AcrR family transcriptional regulator [Halopseudomonas sabulinigri]|uniref:DNA-binding transcriptional regulator, AcrR family n=2 Tax=Halopseudomonas sabulinigri TaxID=472181 RepID=A0A1H1VQJ9_9GAMM|nr:TetR/AcrR family transcriptional regulator [Halopseudomonas sabulinigri]SDS86299.1 DNA-binding transcriptional regulator, AcrR family [Halopseudomonas sabulinigri]
MTAAQRRIHEAALKLFAEKGIGEVNVSALAEAAGVARGTIYNNLDSIESLFEKVAKELSEEMIVRVALSLPADVEPAQRLATGIRFYIRRAHDEPSWGRFLVRYGFSSEALRSMWSGQPLADLQDGLQRGAYDFEPEQATSVLALIAGGVLTAMILVQEGRKTWRDAGSDVAEMLLRAVGVESRQAQSLARDELPALVEAA